MSVLAQTTPHPLKALLWTLALFGFAEFVLLRFIGAMSFQNAIAGGAASGGPISSIGAFCLDAASVLAFVCLLTFALTPIRWRTGWSFVFVAYVVLAAVLPWATAIGPWVPGVFGVISSGVTLVAGMVAIFKPDARGIERVAVALILLAYICSFAYALGPWVLSSAKTVAPGGPGTLGFGEVLYVLAGLFAFRAWGWERILDGARFGLFGGLVAALALSLYLGLGGPSAAAAVTSATGLTLFLPLWVYVLSTFFFATTAFVCLMDGEAFPTGAALILFLIAGLLPGNSYQQALLLLGMTLVAHGERAFATQGPKAQLEQVA